MGHYFALVTFFLDAAKYTMNIFRRPKKETSECDDLLINSIWITPIHLHVDSNVQTVDIVHKNTHHLQRRKQFVVVFSLGIHRFCRICRYVFRSFGYDVTEDLFLHRGTGVVVVAVG